MEHLQPLQTAGDQGTTRCAELVPVVEQAAIAYGTTRTRTQLAGWLRRRVLLIHPTQAEQDHANAVTERRVVHQPGRHGMATLWANLPAHDALAIWRMIDQLAHTTTADADAEVGTIDQRRADALVDLVTGTGSTDPVVEVQVTMSANTLAGVSDHPGDLAGYGPITASHARELAAGDTRWRRLLTDPATGTLLELSQDAYRPSAHLLRTITTRDGTCRFPGCRRTTTATGIDLDHTTDWPAGPTTTSNLAALCRHHHNLKTHTDWTVHQYPGGILDWTTPTGRTFRTHPNGIPPD